MSLSAYANAFSSAIAGASLSAIIGVGVSLFSAGISPLTDIDTSLFSACASRSIGTAMSLFANAGMFVSTGAAIVSPSAGDTSAPLFLSTSTRVSRSTSIVPRSLPLLSSLPDSLFVVMMTKTKSELKEGLKTANLDRPSLSVTLTMKRKRLYDNAFITSRSHALGHDKEDVD